MKALKALVAGMGLLIVIGIGLVGYGLTREKHPQTQTQQVTIGVHEPFRRIVPVSPGTKPSISLVGMILPSITSDGSFSKVMAPEPAAPATPSSTVPLSMVMPPVKLLTAPRTTQPAPSMTMLAVPAVAPEQVWLILPCRIQICTGKTIQFYKRYPFSWVAFMLYYKVPVKSPCTVPFHSSKLLV